MLFSVIIPVYNRPIPVKNAIQSVLDQDYQEWECIVVDDASTDDTTQICTEMAKTDSRIKLYSLDKNSGVSAARNYGLSFVSGNEGCILFLDSDDRLAPNAMSTLSAVIKNTDVEMIVFSYNWHDSSFKLPYHKVLDRSWIHKKILPQHLNIEPHSDGYLQPYIWNKCYKSSLINDHAIRFDEWRKTWEDSAFIIQCLDKCRSLIVIPDKLYNLGDYPDIDHLSKHVDSELFFNYIAGYEKNVEQFGTEYSFYNKYTPRHYFNVIHGLLISYCGKCDKEIYHSLLCKLLENETMKDWVNSITPQDIYERRIVSAYQENDALSLVKIYQELSELQMKVNRPNLSLKDKLKRSARKIMGDNLIDKIKRKIQ